MARYIRLRFIVEGVHDEHVIFHLLVKHGIINPEIEDVDFRPSSKNRNKDFVLSNLTTLLDPKAEQHRQVERFALILDAEAGVPARWQDIRAAISRPIPDQPNLDGTIIVPNIGIWLMPDNLSAGSVEEFFASLIEPEDPLWRHAAVTIPGVPESPRRFKSSQEGKALVNSWLAWNDPPGLPMGKTIARSNLRHDSELALRFVNWVKALLAE